MSQVVGFLNPPLPFGTTLDVLCPQSCQSCGAEPTPEPAAATCTDDSVCSSYSTMFGYAAAAGAGPCLSWSAQQMSSVVAGLSPALPAGTTLDALCPESCQACQPSPPPPAGGSACVSSPCQNGGTCADRVDGTYACTCATSAQTGLPIFWGHNCESSEDDCTLQQVVCSATPRSLCVDCARRLPPSAANPFGGPNPACANGYNCECPEGMEGPACGVDTDECASNPCQNGGACGDSNSHPGQVPVGVFQCVCTSGWYGETCETDADECTALPEAPGGPDPLHSMTCLPMMEVCTDCAKMVGGKMGKPARPNPDCPNGYTCEPAGGH